MTDSKYRRSRSHGAAYTTRRNHPRFQGANFQKNLELADRINEIAQNKGVTATQIALAWLLAQGSDIVPIPGTKQQKYLEENVKAATVTLTAHGLQHIDEVAPKGTTAGDRYPDMRTVNR